MYARETPVRAHMKHARQIGVHVGLPAFFALEVEEVYKHTSGTHRALAFPDFLGFLIGLGLDAYKKQYRQEGSPDVEDEPEEPPEKEGREAALHLFDISPSSLPDLFRKFDEAIELLIFS
jgi:hypothetical protein